MRGWRPRHGSPRCSAGWASEDRGAASDNECRLLRPLLRRDDRVLRLADRVEIDDPAPGEETVLVDVTDPAAVGKACQDVDAVLHLGGLSTEAAFDDILAVNVVGTHNLLRAAV